MMLKKINLTRDINKCYARLSGFVCCRYLDSCLRRCSQLFCSTDFALPNTNIDCETNWKTNHERSTDINCDKYKMFDSCLRRCSQLFWSSDFASAVASCSFVPFQFLWTFFYKESRFVLNIAYFSNIDTKTNSSCDTNAISNCDKNTNFSCDTNAFSKYDKFTN